MGFIYDSCLLCIYYLFFDTFLERKKEWKWFWVILFFMCVAFGTRLLGALIDAQFGYFNAMRLPVTTAKLFITHLAVALPFHGSIKKKALLALALVAVEAVFEVLGVFIYVQLVQYPLDEYLLDPQMASQVIAFTGMILFLAVTVIRFCKKKSGRATKRTYMDLMELVVPVISVSIFGYLARLRYQEVTPVVLFILLMNIVVFFVYNWYYRQAREHDLREQQRKFQERHYQELEAHQSQVRAMKHDMKNQLIVLDAYARAGALEKVSGQINALIDQLADSGKYTFTQHAGVNGLLAQTYKQAEEEGILCELRVSLPQETGIADPDLASLLGNILDNALEACRYCQGKRYIRLEIRCGNGVFLLKSENSADGRSQTTKTRKEDAARHGIGMGNIKQVVEKYGGEMQYQFSPDHFELELSLFSPK